MTGQREDLILVPRKPTPEMVYAALDGALAEDAETVWTAMIEEYENSTKERELSDR